jgi:formylglycine-generating enzyme required for sulfatase activity
MKNPVKDEQPTKTSFRFIRGGDSNGGVAFAHVSLRRYNYYPDREEPDLGFRIVRNIPKDKK